MPYEIDFLPVGSGEKSGDAIAFRYWAKCQTAKDQTVVVVDGGTTESGKAIVEHIKTHYKTNTVNVVFATHCHNDHTSGLKVVLEDLDVGVLCMHCPWEHASNVREMFRDGRITDESLEKYIKESLQDAYDLHQLAKRKGIRLVEPFSDMTWPRELTVLGPSKSYYEELLPDFTGTPLPKVASLTERVVTMAKEGINWVAERWDFETLEDPEENATSAENNSGVILVVQLEEGNLLLTGDAGVDALTRAARHADIMGIDISRVRFIQVPHHGSKHNVGPTILNKIVGPRLPKGQTTTKLAYISASKEDPKHPSRKVTNAFTRRGCRVCQTKGLLICHYVGTEPRTGWVPIEALPFFEHVEE